MLPRSQSKNFKPFLSRDALRSLECLPEWFLQCGEQVLGGGSLLRRKVFAGDVETGDNPQSQDTLEQKSCHLSGKGSVVDAEGLFPPVGEGPPRPFEGAEAEMAQPDGTDNDNHSPDAKDDSIKLVPLELAEEAKAVAFEEGGANQRSKNVIGKSHSADAGESSGGAAQGAEFDHQKNHGDVAQGSEAPDFIRNQGGDPGIHAEMTLCGRPDAPGVHGQPDGER